jgi:RHS repeat-associated protein
VNERSYDWTLSYTGTGSATIEVRDGGTVLFTRTWATGMDAGNALKLYVKSSAGIPVGARITATSGTLNGQPAAASLQTAGTGEFSEQALNWFYPAMAQGFTATGTVKLAFTGSYPPTGSRLNFIVTAGTLPCTPAQAQAKLYFIHVDHLNTPRLIADDQQRTVWRWDNTDPFGGNPPDENPSGLGAFEFPLRFPGQYADKETNLHYNYFRDYDPSLGRYGESDPIGLRGGLNTYAYVYDNPLDLVDPKGLDTYICTRPLRATLGFSVGGFTYRKTVSVPVVGPVYHQYVCTWNDVTGKIVCGSIGPSGPATRSPARLTGPNDDDIYDPTRCQLVAPPNSCLEDCIASRLTGDLPLYDYRARTRLGTPGSQECQIFTNNIFQSCKQQCGAP